MHGCGSAEGLKKLPWQKRGCDAEGHVFSPGFLEVEPDAFCNAQRCVGEERKADSAQELVIHEGSALEDEVDKARLRSKPQMVSKPGQEVGQILVDKAQRSYAGGNEEQRLGEFERGNQQQPLIVVATFRGEREFALDDFLCRTGDLVRRAPYRYVKRWRRVHQSKTVAGGDGERGTR